jgi:hypothetical protein
LQPVRRNADPMKSTLFALFALFPFLLSAQESITLLNGKVIRAAEVQMDEFSISFRKESSSSFRRMDNYRVFSVTRPDGSETVVYRKDPEDSLDFTPEQMRLFIKGEQEADRVFKGTGNKITAVCIGAGASLLTFYGLAVPPLYSTVVGGFSPNMKRARLSDPAMRDVPEFCEGYQRKVRDKKIRQSFLFGMAGFVASFAALSIISR